MRQKQLNDTNSSVKPNENGLKMNICLLTLYLNHFNENKLKFGGALRKPF